MYYFENGELNPEITNKPSESPSKGVFNDKKCDLSLDLKEKREVYDPSYNISTRKCQGYAGNDEDMLEESNCLASDIPEDVRRLCICEKEGRQDYYYENVH